MKNPFKDKYQDEFKIFSDRHISIYDKRGRRKSVLCKLLDKVGHAASLDYSEIKKW
jgi:hypothetical protein